jgi:hypothetical protein
MSYHWTTPQKNPKRGRDYTNKLTPVNLTETSLILNSQFLILNSRPPPGMSKKGGRAAFLIPNS